MNTRALAIISHFQEIPNEPRFVSPVLEKPSFLKGMARTLDIGATLHVYDERITAAEADLVATYSDWQVVGQDLWRAINQHNNGGIISAN